MKMTQTSMSELEVRQRPPSYWIGTRLFSICSTSHRVWEHNLINLSCFIYILYVKSVGIFIFYFCLKEVQHLAFDTLTNHTELFWRAQLLHLACTAHGWLNCLSETICCSADSKSSLWHSELCSDSDFNPITFSQPSSSRRTYTALFCKARLQAPISAHIPNSSWHNPSPAFPLQSTSPSCHVSVPKQYKKLIPLYANYISCS